MKKWIYFPIISLFIAELLMFYDKILPGLYIHIVNIMAITLLIIFGNSSIDIKNVLQSLSLVILLRIISLSMPQFFTDMLKQYSLIYGVMFIPIYIIIKNQQISYKELGLNFKRLYIYLPSAVIIGSVIALLDYKILKPDAIIDNLDLSEIIFISLVMFSFVGIIEELMFRSILQTRIEKIFGLKYGILLSGFIFGIMHSIYGIMNEILFAILFGIILAYIFHKTKSLAFIVSIHGIANIMLFGILPFYKII